jgi:hypothetical protein
MMYQNTLQTILKWNDVIINTNFKFDTKQTGHKLTSYCVITNISSFNIFVPWRNQYAISTMALQSISNV